MTQKNAQEVLEIESTDPKTLPAPPPPEKPLPEEGKATKARKTRDLGEIKVFSVEDDADGTYLLKPIEHPAFDTTAKAEAFIRADTSEGKVAIVRIVKVVETEVEKIERTIVKESSL